MQFRTTLASLALLGLAFSSGTDDPHQCESYDLSVGVHGTSSSKTLRFHWNASLHGAAYAFAILNHLDHGFGCEDSALCVAR